MTHCNIHFIQFLAKIHGRKHSLQKFPIYSIISLCHINLQSTIKLFPLLPSCKKVKDFMSKENFIRDIPSLNKSILKGSNKRVHERLKTINQQLRDNLVNHITQTNGSKVIHIIRASYFRNEGDISSIERLKKRS